MKLWSRYGSRGFGRPAIAAVAGAAVALSLLDLTSAQTESDASSPAPSFAVGLPGGRSFADVIDEVSPAVVNIAVTKVARRMPTLGGPNRGSRGATPFDEFFGRFFDMPGSPGAPRRSQGQGSGFIIDADGYVATNYHVVEGAEEVTVTLNSGEELAAAVVGQDPQTDIALLKVDANGSLPALSFGDSDRARVGDWVLAIGNPFGLGGTATAGIISARGRDIASGPYDDYLQIDAPINSGNSGGPVFNGAGEVIGINTAIFSPNGGNIGIGFAIPSNQAERVLGELMQGGSVSRGWLGVQIQSVDEALAAALGLDDVRGALIADVVPDSPAARAGLESGDVVTAFAGEPIDSARALGRAVGSAPAGEQIELRVWRDGRSRELTVELGRRDGETAASAPALRPEAGPAADFGMTLDDLSRARRAELGLPDDVAGALVVDVARGGPAAAQGIQPGDVIVAIDREPIANAGDAARALAAAGADDPALVLLRRGDAQRFVALKPA